MVISTFKFLAKAKKIKQNKLFIGFSDITSIANFLQDKWGWKIIAAPVLLQLANNEITKSAETELKEFEGKLLEAQGNLSSIEYEIFTKVREDILEEFDNIKKISEKSANIDFLSNMAYVAYENNYVQPKMTKS